MAEYEFYIACAIAGVVFIVFIIRQIRRPSRSGGIRGPIIKPGMAYDEKTGKLVRTGQYTDSALDQLIGRDD